MHPEPQRTGPPSSHSDSTTHRSLIKVLFVDPDAARARRLSESLSGTCAVAIVGSAQAAVGALLQDLPDLIITDLELPDATGTDFIARVHAAPTTRHIVLMVLTARASLRDKITALTAGADDYVIWPISPEAFALRVRLLARFRRRFVY